MSEINPLRALGALVLRDLGCTLRTPVIVLMGVLSVALCWMVAQWIGDLGALDELTRLFVLASDATVPPLMGGSSVALFLLVEEREHGACAALARAGVPLGAMVASKVLAATVFTAAIVLACLAATDVPAACWAPATLMATAASLPFLVIAAALGATLRAYSQTSIWCLLLVCLALPTEVATLDPALAPLATAMPLQAGASAVTWLATGIEPTEGWAVAAGVFAAWAVISAAVMAVCLRLRGRQDAAAD